MQRLHDKWSKKYDNNWNKVFLFEVTDSKAPKCTRVNILNKLLNLKDCF
jgi:hypothetical protein